jgi:TonB family protein
VALPGHPENTDQELNLLREWREPVTAGRIARAAVGSLIAHVLMIYAFVTAPETAFVGETPPPPVEARRLVPLYIPVELTQRDPNKGRISHNLDVRSAAAPASVPQAPRFRAPVPAPVPAVAPAAPPEPPKAEPPKIEAVAEPAPPPPPAGRLPQLAPPPPPPPEKPKLAFEEVGAQGPLPRSSFYTNPSSRIPDPRSAAESAARASVQPSQGSSGVVVGDVEEMTASPSQAAVNGPVRSNLQLLSDAKGVDFKPYLMQALTAVRANWLAVIPESARLGRKGRVLVQFIIDRRGRIPKLVIAESSGTAALDRAAVAGISASSFPPLPNNFAGEEIRVQMVFSYNLAAR